MVWGLPPKQYGMHMCKQIGLHPSSQYAVGLHLEGRGCNFVQEACSQCNNNSQSNPGSHSSHVRVLAKIPDPQLAACSACLVLGLVTSPNWDCN